MGARTDDGGEMGDTLGEPYPSVSAMWLYIKGEADTDAGVGMERDAGDDASGGIDIDGWVGRLLG